MGYDEVSGFSGWCGCWVYGLGIFENWCIDCDVGVGVKGGVGFELVSFVGYFCGVY